MTPPHGQHIRAIAGLAMTVMFALASHDSGFAQAIDENLWTANGPVHAVVRDGGTIYIGGEFTHVGPATGGGVPLDIATGALPPSFPKVKGSVHAVISDGVGGWYIGGNFTAVGGFPRGHLAHVESDLSVSAWNPNADNNDVTALAMSGTTVYAGGNFSIVGGQSRPCVAALDATTGMATTWNPSANAVVYALAVSGSVVYAAGDFSNIGGQSRSNIAALDAATGAATAWSPGSGFAPVYALAVSGSTIYVGGSFASMGGEARNNIAALDATTGNATAWNPDANGTVRALAVTGTTVYAGGEFLNIGGGTRNFVAALDATAGSATAWDASAGGPVHALAVNGSAVHVGGAFRSIGGQSRGYIAALDAATGLATAWNPNANFFVQALAVSGSSLYAGGDFTSVGGLDRNRLAAFDATTGAPTAWDPDVPGINVVVNALAVSGSVVYAGGYFGSAGGQGRSSIAALDATTGAATSWNPAAAGTVTALTVSGSVVYAGGSFFNIGGQTRNNIAALDAATGAATAWDPSAGVFGDFVSALVVSGSTVYAGGSFATIGGQSRNRIAALDASTGLATEWNPDANGNVWALAASGSSVYAGGTFTNIGGQTRNYIAELDAATGSATAWHPFASDWVDALAVSGATIYAGGYGGPGFGGLMAVDAVTGTVNPAWNPGANDENGHPRVYALAVSGPTVYAGGTFTIIGGLPHSFIAAMGDLTTPTLLSLASMQAAADRVRLTWYAAGAHGLTATVYRSTMSAGWRQLGQVSADGTGRIVYEDTDVSPGARYGYRLGVTEGDREVFLGETWVDVPRAAEFALAGARPNPARSDLTIAFSLSGTSPARLEVLDLAGRKLLTRDVRGFGAGNHVLNLAEGTLLAPGVYILRLTQDGRSVTTPAVVVR